MTDHEFEITVGMPSARRTLADACIFPAIV